MGIHTLTTQEMRFQSFGDALQHLDRLGYQPIMVAINNLRVAPKGGLSYCGSIPIGSLIQTPLTDTAVQQLNGLVEMPQGFANKIDPKLHAHCLNERFQDQDGTVTVMVEYDKKEPENRRVVAVVLGSGSGISDALILNHLQSCGLCGCVRMRSGQMEVYFGDAATSEVLPGDEMQVRGVLHNAHWGQTKATTRPSLEISIYTLRLVCSNGAYIKRVLAEGRLMSWASRQQIEQFLDRQLNRVFAFQETVLKEAVALMSETIPEESECEEISRLISRVAGTKRAENLLREAVSWWDHFNAVTAAANQVESIQKARKLQIEGGALLERFLL